MFRAFRRFAKRTVYSPWPYLLFLSPVVFYLGLLVTADIGNGWPAFALTMVDICVIGRSVVDQAAAVEILQSWLDGRAAYLRQQEGDNEAT